MSVSTSILAAATPNGGVKAELGVAGSHFGVEYRVSLSVEAEGIAAVLHCVVDHFHSVGRVVVRSLWDSGSPRAVSLELTSNQARLPAEFKHITKRRKRN